MVVCGVVVRGAGVHHLPLTPPGKKKQQQALTAALYAEAGVRGVEIGSSCFGHVDPDSGEFVPARLELLRLAVPRRVYTDNHLAYVAAALCRLHRRRASLRGLRRVYATPLLSHFTARFEPLANNGGGGPGGRLGPCAGLCEAAGRDGVIEDGAAAYGGDRAAANGANGAAAKAAGLGLGAVVVATAGSDGTGSP